MEQPTSARSNTSSDSSLSTTSKRQSSIHSIQENEPNNVDKPVKSSTLDENIPSPIKKTSSFSSLNLSGELSQQNDVVDGIMNALNPSSGSTFRRTGSHGKLITNLYGNCK